MDEAALRRQAERISDRLDGHRRLLFITGAGLSAESGLPTYRGVGGLYNDGQTEAGLPIEDVLSGPMFEAQPELCWRHIARLERSVRGAQPSAAHSLLAALQRKHDVVVLTQNVDGLHRLAGQEQVIDIHGDFRQLSCTRCAHREARTTYEGLPIPPRCPLCGAIVRPDVVLFHEALPIEKLDGLRAALRQGFDVYFSIGTSSVFPYIFRPIVEAARRGQLTVEINPEETLVSNFVDIRFACGASRALSAIFREFC